MSRDAGYDASIDPFADEKTYVPPLQRGVPTPGPKRPRFVDDDEAPLSGDAPQPQPVRRLPRFDVEGDGDPLRVSGGEAGEKKPRTGLWAGGRAPVRTPRDDTPREDERDFLLPAKSYERAEDSLRWRYLVAFARATYLLEGPGTGEFGSPDGGGPLACGVRRAGTLLLGELVVAFETYRERCGVLAQMDELEARSSHANLSERVEISAAQVAELRDRLAEWAGVPDAAVVELLGTIQEAHEELLAA